MKKENVKEVIRATAFEILQNSDLLSKKEKVDSILETILCENVLWNNEVEHLREEIAELVNNFCNKCNQ